MFNPKKALTLGDAMITFNPDMKGPLRFVQSFTRKVGGAELNFAIGCARLGLPCKWISRLGNDDFGTVILNTARGEGIDVSDVELVNGYPTSINFKEIREDGSGKTFYYRYHSPILTLKPEHLSSDCLNDVDHVHLTGVFLAIHPDNLAVALRLIELAKAKKISISFDPNIRLKLWSIEEAVLCYNKIFPEIDFLLTGKDEINLILQQSQSSISTSTYEQFVRQYEITELIIKDGKNGASLFTNNTWYEQAAFNVQAVDTVGAGDGFDAGYIYSYLNGYSIAERLKFANAVGALTTTVVGDNEGLPYLNEVQDFIANKKVIER